MLEILKALKTERGVHTETLLTSIGAVAGFAAQNAALDRVTSKERDLVNPPLSMAIARAKSGEAFLFGDAIVGDHNLQN
jgi:hypothetical protein